MKRSLLLPLAALVALVAFAAPRGVRADEAADMRAAKALLDRGVALYDQGDYGGALDLFQRGYAIYPSATLLMNMGTTYVQLGRGADAANAYQAFLDDAAAAGPRASEIRSSLAILDTTLGRLAITVDADVQVQLGDGQWLEARRAHLVRVPPGTYVVRARRGDRIVDVSGRIGAGEEQAVAPVIAAAAPPVVPAAHVDRAGRHAAAAADDRRAGAAELLDEPLAPAPRSRRRTYALIAGGAGVVALGAGLALALRATATYDEARALCERPDGCGADRDRAVALTDRADTARLLAISATALGAAALATGTVLWITAPRRAAPATAITFTATPRELGLAAAGTF